MSHLTDLRLAAASPQQRASASYHLLHPHFSSFHPFFPPFSFLLPQPCFLSFFLSIFLFFPSSPLCSSSASAQRQKTKGIVGSRQKSERAARQRVGWCGEFISGSLHFAWRSPERRRQGETSIQFFFFFFYSLRGRSCKVGVRMGGCDGVEGRGEVTDVFCVHDRLK